MKTLVVWLLVVGGLLYGALSWITAEWLLGHHHRPVRETPASLGLAFEELELRAADGVRLEGWIVQPRASARGTVLVFHGLHGMKDGLPLFFLEQHGLRGLALDLRAHGQSEGEYTTFGWTERLDVEAAIAYARERWPGEPLGAWGQSLGAAALAFADAAATLDAVVLEGCYADIEVAWRTRVDLGLPPWARGLAWLPKRIIAWRLGPAAASLRPVDRVGRLPAERLLLIRSDGDRMLGEAEFAALAREAPGAAVLRAPNSVHLDALVKGGGAFRDELAAFLLSRFERPR